MEPRQQVFLIWRNELVIGVCGTRARAEEEAEAWRKLYPGSWVKVSDGHWCAETRDLDVQIDQRTVV